MKGILYIIDLSDPQRLEEALKWLANLLSQQESKDKYLFIIGNKKDIAGPTVIESL
jgi:50S ribosomal subunit-associated GTPase HflX